MKSKMCLNFTLDCQAASAPMTMPGMPEGPPPKPVLTDKDLAQWFKDYTGLRSFHQPPLHVVAGAREASRHATF